MTITCANAYLPLTGSRRILLLNPEEAAPEENGRSILEGKIHFAYKINLSNWDWVLQWIRSFFCFGNNWVQINTLETIDGEKGIDYENYININSLEKRLAPLVKDKDKAAFKRAIADLRKDGISDSDATEKVCLIYAMASGYSPLVKQPLKELHIPNDEELEQMICEIEQITGVPQCHVQAG